MFNIIGNLIAVGVALFGIFVGVSKATALISGSTTATVASGFGLLIGIVLVSVWAVWWSVSTFLRHFGDEKQD